ncbi:MAG: 6-bladed beta-propeller [Acidobacteriota bacterium]|nr:6-bladed beta-propeller [Acidobacteriota bacterium]
MLLCLFYLLSVEFVEVETGVVYDPVPEDSEVQMMFIRNIAMDESQNMYALDTRASVVFSWDQEGHYRMYFGHAGSGPGEFGFNEHTQQQAAIAYTDGMICVYDGQQGKLHFFDTDGNFIEDKPLGDSPGPTRFFRATKSNAFVLNQHHYKRTGTVSILKLFDDNFKKVMDFKEFPERYWIPKRTDGKFVGWKVNAFAPELVVYAGAESDEVLIGRNEGPYFEVVNLLEKKSWKVPFKVGRRDVSRDDIREFKTMSWVKKNPAYELKFPDKHPYYRGILPVDNRGYLLYSTSPVYRVVHGTVIDKAGKALGKFRYECGEDGGIDGVQGRIFSLDSDVEGAYTLKELKLKLGAKSD